jgi:uncharacterized protein (TIGR03086 family)
MSTPETLQLTTPSDTEIVMTRSFTAPRDQVFAALTEPDLLKRWIGARGWELIECDSDLRVGGSWRQVSRGPQGERMVMFGEFVEIVPPERLVTTEVFEGSEHESLVTTTLHEAEGATTLTMTVRYPSPEVRDAMLRTNMARGAGESFDRLDDVLRWTGVSDRFRRLSGRFSELIAAARDDQWSNPSPCAGWTARDVVRHLVEMCEFNLSLIDRRLPDGAPSVDEDPRVAWSTARQTIQELVDDPAVASATHKPHVHLGEKPWGLAVDMTLSSDLVIHNWDLATALGIDERIDPAEVRAMLDGLAEFPEEAIRSPEVFGDALEPPSGADEQTRLLAFTGRKAWGLGGAQV